MKTLFFVLKGSGWKAIQAELWLLEKTLWMIKKAGQGAAWGINKLLSVSKKIGSAALAPVKLLYSTFKSLAALIGTVVYGAVKKTFSLIIDLGAKAFQHLRGQIKASIDDFLTFEKEADRTFGLVVGRGKIAFQQIKDMAYRVSLETGKNLTEVMIGGFEIMSAGFRTAKDAEDVLLAAAKLAHAGWVSVDDAVKVLITSMNAYGIEAEYAANVTAVLYQTQIQGRGTMGQFAGLLGNILPIAASLRIRFQEAAAATALVTKVMGQKGRVMFTVVAMLRHMISATGQTAEAWKKFGYQVVRTKEGMVDFEASMRKLRQIRKVGEAMGLDPIREMFKHQAALRGIGIVTQLSEQQFTEVMSSMKNFGLMQKDFIDSSATTWERYSRILEAWATRFVTLKIMIVDMFGNAFKPVFDSIIKILDKAFQKFLALFKAKGWKKLEESLKKVAAQFQASKFWVAILALLEQHFDRLIDVVDWLTNSLNKLAANDGVKKFFDDLQTRLVLLGYQVRFLHMRFKVWLWNTKKWVIGQKKAWEDWKKYLIGIKDLVKGELITAWDNWGKAVEKHNPTFEQAKDIFSDLFKRVFGTELKDASKNFWKFVKEDLPNAIAGMENIDIDSVLIKWIDKFQSFRVGMSDIWISIASTIETALQTIITVANAAIANLAFAMKSTFQLYNVFKSIELIAKEEFAMTDVAAASAAVRGQEKHIDKKRIRMSPEVYREAKGILGGLIDEKIKAEQILAAVQTEKQELLRAAEFILSGKVPVIPQIPTGAIRGPIEAAAEASKQKALDPNSPLNIARGDLQAGVYDRDKPSGPEDAAAWGAQFGEAAAAAFEDSINPNPEDSVKAAANVDYILGTGPTPYTGR